MNNKTTAERSVFLDAIRSLMIILVLVFHAGASYGESVSFWPFHEDNPIGIIDFFLFICDVFFMAVMFFIAGYFMLPDLLKKGYTRFINGKLKRLGFPWLVITAAVLPALDYVHYVYNHTQQSLPSAGFIEYWLLCMKKIGGFYTGWLDMSSYYYIPEHFYQRYMWFLSLLLVFFILSALIYRLGGGTIKWCDRTADSNKTAAKILIGSSIIMIILFSLVRFFAYPAFMDSGWFSLGNIIQFQSGKLVIYGVSFYLGIRAYSGKWFPTNNHFWKIHFWGALCFCLFGLNMLVLKNIDAQENPLFILKTAFCIVYPLWTLSFLGLFLSLGLKYWRRPSKYKRRLPEYSYTMYLVHYIVPFTLPLLLHGLSIPALLKFIITALVTLLFSYAAGLLSMKLRRKKSLPLNVE